MWNSKKCYEVIVTSNNGEEDLFKRKICQPCGDQINTVYESGLELAQMEERSIDEEAN